MSRIPLQRPTRPLAQRPALFFLKSVGLLLLPVLTVGVTACGDEEGIPVDVVFEQGSAVLEDLE